MYHHNPAFASQSGRRWSAMTVPGGYLSWQGWFTGKALPLTVFSVGLFAAGLTLPRETVQLARDGISIYPMLHLLRHCLTMGFLLLVLAAYLSRTRPMAPACGFWEKVFPLLLAFAGPIGLLVLERFAMPHSWGALSPGVPLALLGSGVSVWALWHLRASFAIMIEARGPVTSGPYRFVRHPLYLGEAFTMLGLCLINGTIGAVLFWAVFTGLQLTRAGIEEGKLAHQFADYRSYREQTPFILPWLY